MIGAVRRRMMGNIEKDIMPNRVRYIIHDNQNVDVGMMEIINSNKYLQVFGTNNIVKADGSTPRIIVTVPQRTIEVFPSWGDKIISNEASFNYFTNSTIIVDIPDGFDYVGNPNQPFRIQPTSKADFIFRNKTTAFIDNDNFSVWCVYNWDASRVTLYVPGQLVAAYANNSVISSRCVIMPIESSQYKKRIPLEKLYIKS